MFCKIMILVGTYFAANILCSTQVTVEEGKPVTLKCTESVSKTSITVFSWYKERKANQSTDNKIAFYDNYDGVQNSLGDFANRATVDGTTGALTILSTKVSDEHIYSCWFQFTATGDIKYETQLTITDIPAGQPKIIQGDKKTVSLTCDTEQIDGIITWYKWQFANGTDLGNTTEKTWTYTARENEETLQIVCVAGNAAGQTYASPSIEIEIRKNGQHVNTVIVVLGILLALSVAKDFVSVVYYCLRNNSTYGRAIILNTVPIQKDGARCVTRDQGLAFVEAPAYEEVDNRPRTKGLDLKIKQNLKDVRYVTRDQGLAMVDAAAYDEVDDGAGIKGRDWTLKQNLKGGEAPTYLKLH